MGRNLFAALTWLCLPAALSAGLFFTSDSLSEEKREGTLGFLFLTSLRGYDVVFGKLLAGGIRGLYVLLAVLPILAVTLLMGGVSGSGFFKTSLALLNALLASIVTGLFASSISRDSYKALAATIALLGLWVAAGPAADGLFAATTKRSFSPVLSISSPGYLFVVANAFGQTFFWWALLVNQFLAWTLVGLSSVLVRRTWQDKPASTARPRQRFTTARTRASLRRKLMDKNPVLWLASLDRWPTVALWGVSIVMTGSVLATFIPRQSFLWILWTYLGVLFSLVIYLFLCAQAARFFVEARRSGVLELLLATPLTAHQIVHGQWRALLRMFAVPLLLFLAAYSVSTFMTYDQLWQLTASATTATPTATNTMAGTNITVVTKTVGTIPGAAAGTTGTPPQLLVIAMSAAGTVAVLMNAIALVWFAMWMGLTSKNTSLATLKTIFWLQILPWFAISFLASSLVGFLLFLFPKKTTTSAIFWFPMASAAFGILLSLAKDVFFYFWARRRLDLRFRAQASTTLGQPRK
jgi:ABC-type transport system involved in multi-copper enzyme maturation permease subunit